MRNSGTSSTLPLAFLVVLSLICLRLGMGDRPETPGAVVRPKKSLQPRPEPPPQRPSAGPCSEGSNERRPGVDHYACECDQMFECRMESGWCGLGPPGTLTRCPHNYPDIHQMYLAWGDFERALRARAPDGLDPAAKAERLRELRAEIAPMVGTVSTRETAPVHYATAMALHRCLTQLHGEAYEARWREIWANLRVVHGPGPRRRDLDRHGGRLAAHVDDASHRREIDGLVRIVAEIDEAIGFPGSE